MEQLLFLSFIHQSPRSIRGTNRRNKIRSEKTGEEKLILIERAREREREKSWLNVSRAVFVIGNSILIFHLSRVQRRS